MLTLEDLREALQPAPGQEQRKLRDQRLARRAGLPDPPKTPSRAMRLGRGMLGWVMFVVLAVMLYFLLDKNPRRGSGAPPGDQPPIDLWLSVIPSALGAAGVGAFLLTITLANFITKRRARATGKPDTPTKVIQIGLMISLGLAVLSLWVMTRPPLEINWRPDRSQVAIAAVMPWVIVFAMMFGLFRIAARRGTQTMYDTNPTFRRQHRSHLDAEGIHEDDGVTKVLYRWPIFRRAWETDNMLVLDDEANRRHMLPKRALIDAGQLEPARALIVSHVPVTDLFQTPGAFPVNRPPAAPIPAIPINPAEPTPHGGRAD
jgi:hypothetical protein